MGSGASASAQPSPQSSSSGLANGSSNNPKQQAANNSPRPARANGSSQNSGSHSSEPPSSSRQKERGVRFDEQNQAQNAQERQNDRQRSSATAPNLSHVMTREKTLIRESEQPKYTVSTEFTVYTCSIALLTAAEFNWQELCAEYYRMVKKWCWRNFITVTEPCTVAYTTMEKDICSTLLQGR